MLSYALTHKLARSAIQPPRVGRADLIDDAPDFIAGRTYEVGNATERAYRRSDLLEKRRELMAGWARFCCP